MNGRFTVADPLIKKGGDQQGAHYILAASTYTRVPQSWYLINSIFRSIFSFPDSLSGTDRSKGAYKAKKTDSDQLDFNGSGAQILIDIVPGEGEICV